MKKPLILLCCAVLSVAQLVAQEVPKLLGRVSDYAHLYTQQENDALTQRLKEYEDSTSNQVVVLTIPRLNDKDSLSLFDYTMKVCKDWKIGQKGKNNGVVIVIAKSLASKRNAPGIRVMVGTGLQGVLTDAACGEIIRSDMHPPIDSGRYYQGTAAGIGKIISKIAKEFNADHAGIDIAWWQWLLIVILILIVLYILIRYGCSGDGDCILCLDCDTSGGDSSCGDSFSGSGGGFDGGGAGD